jgi:hypothetical protein
MRAKRSFGRHSRGCARLCPGRASTSLASRPGRRRSRPTCRSVNGRRAQSDPADVRRRALWTTIVGVMTLRPALGGVRRSEAPSAAALGRRSRTAFVRVTFDDVPGIRPQGASGDSDASSGDGHWCGPNVPDVTDEPGPSLEAQLEEFREAGQAHRLHVTLMFGQITVFLAASAGLLHTLLGDVSQASARLLGAAVGILISFVFLVHHERVYAYSFAARQPATRLQEDLGLTLYQDPPRPTLLPVRATTASRIPLCGSWTVLDVRGREGGPLRGLTAHRLAVWSAFEARGSGPRRTYPRTGLFGHLRGPIRLR